MLIAVFLYFQLENRIFVFVYILSVWDDATFHFHVKLGFLGMLRKKIFLSLLFRYFSLII